MTVPVRRIKTTEITKAVDDIADISGLKRDEYVRLSYELTDYVFRENRPAFYEFFCRRAEIRLVFKVDMKNVNIENNMVSMDAYISYILATPLGSGHAVEKPFAELNKLLVEVIEKYKG